MMTSSGEGGAVRDGFLARGFESFLGGPEERLDFMHWIVASGHWAWFASGLPSEVLAGQNATVRNSRSRYEVRARESVDVSGQSLRIIELWRHD
jgi:hypothetical protein